MSQSDHKVKFVFLKDCFDGHFESLSSQYVFSIYDHPVLHSFDMFNPVLHDLKKAGFVKKGDYYKPSYRNIMEMPVHIAMYLMQLNFIWLFLIYGLPVIPFIIYIFSLIFNIEISNPKHVMWMAACFGFFISLPLSILIGYLSWQSEQDFLKMHLSEKSQKVFEFLDMVTDHLNQNSYDDKITTLDKLFNSPDHLRQLNDIYQSSKDKDFWMRQIKNMNIDYEFYRGTLADLSTTQDYQILKDNLYDIQNIIIQHPNEKEERNHFDAEKILKDENWESLEQIQNLNIQLKSLMSQYWKNKYKMNQNELYTNVISLLHSQKLQ